MFLCVHIIDRQMRQFCKNPGLCSLTAIVIKEEVFRFTVKILILRNTLLQVKVQQSKFIYKHQHMHLIQKLNRCSCRTALHRAINCNYWGMNVFVTLLASCLAGLTYHRKHFSPADLHSLNIKNKLVSNTGREAWSERLQTAGIQSCNHNRL